MKKSGVGPTENIMGVDEIYDYLKKNKGYHSAKQIAEKLGMNVKSIRKSLSTIMTYKEIVCNYTHMMRNKARKRVGLKTRRTWLYAYKK